MRLVFTATAWNQYLSHTDRKLVKRINDLIAAVMRDGYEGIGSRNPSGGSCPASGPAASIANTGCCIGSRRTMSRSSPAGTTMATGSGSGRGGIGGGTGRKAVPLRLTRGYWFVVWAMRCWPFAMTSGALTAAATRVGYPPLAAVLTVCPAFALIPGALLMMAGTVLLYVSGSMPRDLNPRRQMVGMMWRDAVSPLRRPGRRQQR
ncbi:type II toxin-antitoxin system YoeB family toxin [Micromonospora citrea]|uniref:type II toxin-antitoxin system YoeB family toxin n=1 Tax=Micromonospora citrea TaxID=47855 RepID=UPI003C5CCA96